MTTYPTHAEYNISGGSSVLIENVTILGGSLSSPSGIAITIQNVTGNITIRNVDFRDKIGGIYLLNCSGTLSITNIRGENIGDSSIGSGHSNYIQFNGCVFTGSVSGCQFRAGRTEDMISIFQSGGTGIGSELVIENNHLQGLVSDDAGARAWNSSSGTGIIVGDGGGGNAGNTIVRNNTLLTPGQVGLQHIDGSNIQTYGNIIYGQQRTQNNNPITTFSGNPSGSIHNNTYYWTNNDGSHPTPYNGAGTMTFYSNTQDPSLNPTDYEINF
jgi:hypothetical protein